MSDDELCGHIHCQSGTRTPPHTCVLPLDHDEIFHRDLSGVEWLWERAPLKFRDAG